MNNALENPPAPNRRSPASGGCDARIEKLRARQNAIRLERIEQMLKDAGVPEWVQTIETGPVPSNAPDYRLQWFLARRKNVKPAEIDQQLQKEMADWLRILSQRHNADISDGGGQ